MSKAISEVKITSRKYAGRFEFAAMQIVNGMLSVGVGENAKEAHRNLIRALDRPDISGAAFFTRKAEKADYADVAA